jgi:hypothetical protein
MVVNFCAMPAKKKTKQKSRVQSGRKTRKRAVSAKSSRKTTKKKTARKRTASRPRARGRTESEFKQAFQGRQRTAEAAPSRQTEDLQGLSRAEQADSESVDELAGEGNVFEAGAVAGVEEADSADEKEVHTHEVPEDDVPGEYLDEQ